MSSFHFLDYLVILIYLVLVVILGKIASKSAHSQEGYFLAGRKLGKIYQFLLNFGNSTDANGAVSTASFVYQQGVSAVWIGFQLIFINPYYWFMNTWFRRVRLTTMADLFEDRLGSRSLAAFYALFQGLMAVVVVIGYGNFVTYKIASALIVKEEVVWTAAERASVEGYRELKKLEHMAKAVLLDEAAKARLDLLRERDAAGELKSFVTALPPLPFYLAYTLVVGFYIVMGGLTATAMNEVLQSILTVAFSIVLIPLGLAAIGGWHALGERVPDAMFDLLASGGDAAQQVTGVSLLAIFVVALVQINGIIGNMGISGSAKNEYAARFGAVAGTYGKRLMMIMWAFCGLIAIALYQGPAALADPDAAWGTMSRQLLGPGLLGLMLTGLLANNMDTVAAQTVSVSALFVRNILNPLRPGLGDAAAVKAGRWAIVVVLLAGVFASSHMDNVLSVTLFMQTVAVPLGAAVMLMFFWRRLTVAATWIGLCVAILVNVALPWILPRFESVCTSPAMTVRTQDATGRLYPVFFESVARVRSDDLASPLVGRGRFHLELYLLDRAGLDVASLSPSNRFAARFFFNAISPFLLLIGLSYLTRAPARERIDQFFGKMKTPVGATIELERVAMEETRANPRRFDHTKLLPNSSWEFTKWDRVDTIGFFSCCIISTAIIGLFWFLLQMAKG